MTKPKDYINLDTVEVAESLNAMIRRVIKRCYRQDFTSAQIIAIMWREAKFGKPKTLVTVKRSVRQVIATDVKNGSSLSGCD